MEGRCLIRECIDPVCMMCGADYICAYDMATIVLLDG